MTSAMLSDVDQRTGSGQSAWRREAFRATKQPWAQPLTQVSVGGLAALLLLDHVGDAWRRAPVTSGRPSTVQRLSRRTEPTDPATGGPRSLFADQHRGFPRNREQELYGLIDSVVQQVRPPDQFVVVDAGSNPHLEAELLGRLRGRVPLTYVHAEPGLPHQRNVGVGASTGDILAFLDDDVVLDRDFVAEVVGFFSATPWLRTPQCSVASSTVPEGSRRPRSSPAWRQGAGRVIERSFLLWGDGDGRIKRSGFGTRATPPRCGPVEFLSRLLCLLSSLGLRQPFVSTNNLAAMPGWRTWTPPASFFGWVSRLGVGRVRNWSTRTALRPAWPRLNGRMMAHNHHYLHRKHSGGTWTERAAFAWSLLGLVVWAAGQGDWRRTLGLLEGYRDILARRNPLCANR